MFWCGIGFHKWTCWKNYEYKKTKFFNGGCVDSIYQGQKRYCIKCRMKQLRN